jgi:hypothetical protein
MLSTTLFVYLIYLTGHAQDTIVLQALVFVWLDPPQHVTQLLFHLPSPVRVISQMMVSD